MRTTVDIPDPIYRELKSRAAAEKSSVKELILRSVKTTLQSEAGSPPLRKRVGPPPVIESKNPGSLVLGEEGVYAYISFP